MQARASTGEPQNIEQLALALGLFSVGLGLGELLAPRKMARAIGIRDTWPNLLLLGAFGAREIASGVAILAEPRRSAWMWTRVAGDMADLACLGAAIDADGRHAMRASMAATAVLGVTAVDLLCAEELTRMERRARGESVGEVQVAVSQTINRPAAEVYRFWRDLANLPRFMRHLEAVRAIQGGRSQWVARGPGGLRVSWEAEIVEEREPERLAWRSLPGSEIENSGRVEFRPAPGNRGTEVHVALTYQPPAGALGRGISRLFGEEPRQQIGEDLRRLKQLLEVGEIPMSEGEGLRKPAQPVERHHDVPAAVTGGPA